MTSCRRRLRRGPQDRDVWRGACPIRRTRLHGESKSGARSNVGVLVMAHAIDICVHAIASKSVELCEVRPSTRFGGAPTAPPTILTRALDEELDVPGKQTPRRGARRHRRALAGRHGCANHQCHVPRARVRVSTRARAGCRLVLVTKRSCVKCLTR